MASPSQTATVSEVSTSTRARSSSSASGRQRHRVQLPIPAEELGHARPQRGVADHVGEEVEEQPVLRRVQRRAAVHVHEDGDAVVARLRKVPEQLDVLVVHDRVDERRDEAGLVAEVIADRGLVLAGLGGDRLEAQAGVAGTGQHPPRRDEDAARRRRELLRRVLGDELVAPRPDGVRGPSPLRRRAAPSARSPPVRRPRRRRSPSVDTGPTAIESPMLLSIRITNR